MVAVVAVAGEELFPFCSKASPHLLGIGQFRGLQAKQSATSIQR